VVRKGVTTTIAPPDTVAVGTWAQALRPYDDFVAGSLALSLAEA
jgi:hypothetical protein